MDHGPVDREIITHRTQRGNQRKTKLERFQLELSYAGATSAACKFYTAPLERVRLLMQTQYANPKMLAGEVKLYTGVGNCIRRVYSEQGFKSFWRGTSVNCLRFVPQLICAYSFNDAINSIFPKYDVTEHFWKSLAVKLVSGGLAGVIAAATTYPLDFARTRLACDMTPGKSLFSGTLDCIQTTVRKQGIAGLYTGWGATVAGTFTRRAALLGLFKQVQDLNPYGERRDLVGAVSSFSFLILVHSIVLPFHYPFDTIRRRMMLQAEMPLESRLCKSSTECFQQILAKEGIRGFYRGLVPELFRGAALCFFIAIYDRAHIAPGI